MTNPNRRFRLPLQRLSALANLRIRYRLWQAKQTRAQEASADQVRSWFSARALAPAVSCVLVIAVLGAWQGPGYVYQSDQVIRGDFFYSYKRSQERTKLASLNNPASRANFYLVLSDRRLAEAETAVQRASGGSWLVPTATAAAPLQPAQLKLNPGNNIAAGLVSESAYFVGQSVDTAGKIKNKTTAQQVLQNIQTTTQRQQKVLQGIAQKSPDIVVQQVATNSKHSAQTHASLAQKAQSIVERLPETVSTLPETLKLAALEIAIELDDDDHGLHEELGWWDQYEDDWEDDDQHEHEEALDLADFAEAVKDGDWEYVAEVVEEVFEEEDHHDGDEHEEDKPDWLDWDERWYDEHDDEDWEHWEEVENLEEALEEDDLDEAAEAYLELAEESLKSLDPAILEELSAALKSEDARELIDLAIMSDEPEDEWDELSDRLKEAEVEEAEEDIDLWQGEDSSSAEASADREFDEDDIGAVEFSGEFFEEDPVEIELEADLVDEELEPDFVEEVWEEGSDEADFEEEISEEDAQTQEDELDEISDEAPWEDEEVYEDDWEDLEPLEGWEEGSFELEEEE